jgi:hypothetical protein
MLMSAISMLKLYMKAISSRIFFGCWRWKARMELFSMMRGSPMQPQRKQRLHPLRRAFMKLNGRAQREEGRDAQCMIGMQDLEDNEFMCASLRSTVRVIQ